jgi:hypothetical protein
MLSVAVPSYASNDVKVFVFAVAEGTDNFLTQSPSPPLAASVGDIRRAIQDARGVTDTPQRKDAVIVVQVVGREEVNSEYRVHGQVTMIDGRTKALTGTSTRQWRQSARQIVQQLTNWVNANPTDVANVISQQPPIAPSPSREAFAQTSQPTAKQQQELGEARMLQWFGGALIVGGIVLETLSYTALGDSNEFCTATTIYPSTFASCTNLKTTNWGVMGGGLGLSAAGVLLMLDGGIKKRHAVVPSMTFGPKRFAAGLHVTF